MPGYQADPAGITAAAKVAREAADTLDTGLDQDSCAAVGPDPLVAVTLALTAATREDLARVQESLLAAADLAQAAARAYADHDDATARALYREAGG